MLRDQLGGDAAAFLGGLAPVSSLPGAAASGMASGMSQQLMNTSGDIASGMGALINTSGDIASGMGSRLIGGLASVAGGIADRALEAGGGLLATYGPSLEQRIGLMFKALGALRRDQSFDRSRETRAGYQDTAQALVDNRFKYVVFGHTHLAKHVQLNGGEYLNCGTWADLMRFPMEILDHPEPQAFGMLGEFVAQLEAKKFHQYVGFEPTYVRLDIGDDGNVACAELCDYRG